MNFFTLLLAYMNEIKGAFWTFKTPMDISSKFCPSAIGRIFMVCFYGYTEFYLTQRGLNSKTMYLKHQRIKKMSSSKFWALPVKKFLSGDSLAKVWQKSGIVENVFFFFFYKVWAIYPRLLSRNRHRLCPRLFLNI